MGATAVVIISSIIVFIIIISLYLYYHPPPPPPPLTMADKYNDCVKSDLGNLTTIKVDDLDYRKECSSLVDYYSQHGWKIVGFTHGNSGVFDNCGCDIYLLQRIH